MTDQSDDEFDHDNLVESKVGILGSFEPHSIITNVNCCLVSSVGRAPVCCAGGQGLEPQTRPALRVLK